MLQLLCGRISQHGPALLSKPLRYLPFRIQAPLVERLLNRILAEPIQDGELDFLRGRRLQVWVPDLHYRLTLSFGDGGLFQLDDDDADVVIRGDLNDLIRLSAGKWDPDTLFFQRRLLITGDTELGLECKNLLDRLEPGRQPLWLQRLLAVLAGMLTRAEQSATNSGERPAG
ncbi:ubiquinone anaerobic biosynthesis accessory factor UbiT [Zobellella iuensis]|uniref:Ubiquinone biosynthesis accessory factor UbiT n=1 Tax=Zobellella iuensis TaxID=2803811 RepID=A0ABS1QUW1_9GAMM|nr:SCP2 sterol-binding domain-containing protein [Zobellella iuensis]MBL1378660.1 SCP2 sterol-binding domain-containing protein [Zobellella iuensis]